MTINPELLFSSANTLALLGWALLVLAPAPTDEIVVSKERAPAVKSWLEG